jgi:thiol-disulfide isomerase/thioredoxin
MAADTCCRSQPLYRKRTTYSQYYASTETESCRYRHHSEICMQTPKLSKNPSATTKYFVIFVSALLLSQFLQRKLLTAAFTATSSYRTLYPSRHGQVLLTATAGNAEMEYRQRSNPSNNNSNGGSNNEPNLYANSWKEVPGGFVPQFGNNKSNTQNHPRVTESTSVTDVVPPNLPSSTPSPAVSSSKSSSPMKKNTTPTTMRIRQLSNIKDYKHYVVDDVDPDKVTITVVRFYAPWCRACQAIQQRYYRLAQQYEQRMQLLPPTSRDDASLLRSSSSSPSDVVVRFMECPVTKDNAILHQGLGVPSLPYGHIYHSKVGLVEEMKLNKNVFTNFESTLASYVNGYCTVTYSDDDDAAKTTENTIIPTNNDDVDPATPSTFG